MIAPVIDPEFQALIPAPTLEELAGLREDISKYGCSDPIKVLEGTGEILDGHHRYQICQDLKIPFQVVEIEFPNRTEAKIWIIKNQHARRNLTESQRAILAVTLEALYAEQAKERQGTRTDLGQPLDENEVGRSVEKAAKDMGISHQLVSSAKKVVNLGIPELAQMVEDDKMAVGTAAIVADLPPEQQVVVQAKIADKSNRKVQDGKPSSRVTESEVVQIIRGTSPKGEVTPEENLDKVEQHLKSVTKILEGVEITAQREKLTGLLELGEQIIQQVKAIGLRSPVIKRTVETVPSDYQLEIDAQTLKFFLDSVIPAEKGFKLIFGADGLKIISYNDRETNISVSFMPKDYFSKYELEPCEICLRNFSELYENIRFSKKVQIFIEAETEYVHDRVMKIYSGYEACGVTRDATIRLARLEFGPKNRGTPKLNPPCVAVVSISSKDFVRSLGNIRWTQISDENNNRRHVRNATFSIEDSKIKIVADDGSIQKIPCNVLVQGEVDSSFDVYPLSGGDIGNVVEKSDTITLGMGKDYPMIVDLTIGKMTIEYIMAPLIPEDRSEECEIYRGVLADGNGIPIKAERVEFQR